jgi:hypothetical protein
VGNDIADQVLQSEAAGKITPEQARAVGTAGADGFEAFSNLYLGGKVPIDEIYANSAPDWRGQGVRTTSAPPPEASPESPLGVWNDFAAKRQPVDIERAKSAKMFAAQLQKAGHEAPRISATQVWERVNIVNKGFVKDLLVPNEIFRVFGQYGQAQQHATKTAAQDDREHDKR